MSNNISNEQFNNIVEPFSNSQNDNIQNKKNEKNSHLHHDKNKVGLFFLVLAVCLGNVIVISYLGANLVFYKWALQPLTRCSSKNYNKLFDIIFPTECNEPICTGKTKSSSGGGSANCESCSGFSKRNLFGSGNIRECIIQNSNIDDFCKTSKPSSSKFDLINPGFKEWFVRSYKFTNNNVHDYAIKHIIEHLPSGKLCWVTFILGFILIPIIFLLLVPPVAFVAMLINMFKEAISIFYSSPFISVFILIFLGIGFSLPIASIYTIVITLLVMVKLVFYPVMMGGKDTLLKIVGNNLFLINILVWITSLVTVITMSNIVNKNIYIGVLIAYVPLSLFYLYKIFK